MGYSTSFFIVVLCMAHIGCGPNTITVSVLPNTPPPVVNFSDPGRSIFFASNFTNGEACVQTDVLAAGIINEDFEGRGGDVINAQRVPVITTFNLPTTSPTPSSFDESDVTIGFNNGGASFPPIQIEIPANSQNTSVGMAGVFRLGGKGASGSCVEPTSATNPNPFASVIAVGSTKISDTSQNTIVSVPLSVSRKISNLKLISPTPSPGPPVVEETNTDLKSDRSRDEFILTWIQFSTTTAFTLFSIEVILDPTETNNPALFLNYPLFQANTGIGVPAGSPSSQTVPGNAPTNLTTSLGAFPGYAIPHIFPMTFKLTGGRGAGAPISCSVTFSSEPTATFLRFPPANGGRSITTWVVSLNPTNCSGL